MRLGNIPSLIFFALIISVFVENVGKLCRNCIKITTFVHCFRCQYFKHAFYMKKLLTLFLLTTLATTVGWAADETITFSAQSYSNGEAITTVNGTDFTITFDKGSNSNAPKYYTNGTAIRVYGGNTFTVSSSTKTIAKIEITFGSDDGSNAITTNVGTYSNGIWTGSALSVRFTVDGTSGNRRLRAIAVTYSSGGGSTTTVEAPTLTEEFTFWPVMNDEPSAQVTITPASGNTVRYTTNGSTPSRTSGTEITAATTITINATTTVKAISYVGTQTSAVVSKTYTLGETVTGIAAFKNVPSGTAVRLYLPDSYNARTLYVNGKEAFVRDNTGAMCIYNVKTNPALEYNQHIAGWIIGTYTEYNGLPEFTAHSATNSCYLVIAGKVTEEDVEPVEVAAADVSTKYADWVTVKNLNSSSDVAVNNKYGLGTDSYYQDPYEGAIYDITGIAYPNNGNPQVAPIYQNDNRPITYVIDSEQTFTSPSAPIENAQVRLQRSLNPMKWSLLTVPFDIVDFEGEVLAYKGVTLGEVGTYESQGKTYSILSGVMEFEDYYGQLSAGTPYFVRPSMEMNGFTLTGVTLNSGDAGSVTHSLSQQNAPVATQMAAAGTPAYVGDYSLVGTYSPTTLPKDESTVVMIDNNTLSWTSLVDDTSVGGTEAYITVPNGAGVKIDLGGNGTVTAINEVRIDDHSTSETVIYNLLGVRLTRPIGELPPGIYIVNGKKIVKR